MKSLGETVGHPGQFQAAQSVYCTVPSVLIFGRCKAKFRIPCPPVNQDVIQVERKPSLFSLSIELTFASYAACIIQIDGICSQFAQYLYRQFDQVASSDGRMHQIATSVALDGINLAPAFIIHANLEAVWPRDLHKVFRKFQIQYSIDALVGKRNLRSELGHEATSGLDRVVLGVSSPSCNIPRLLRLFWFLQRRIGFFRLLSRSLLHVLML